MCSHRPSTQHLATQPMSGTSFLISSLNSYSPWTSPFASAKSTTTKKHIAWLQTSNRLPFITSKALASLTCWLSFPSLPCSSQRKTMHDCSGWSSCWECHGCLSCWMLIGLRSISRIIIITGCKNPLATMKRRKTTPFWELLCTCSCTKSSGWRPSSSLVRSSWVSCGTLYALICCRTTSRTTRVGSIWTHFTQSIWNNKRINLNQIVIPECSSKCGTLPSRLSPQLVMATSALNPKKNV